MYIRAEIFVGFAYFSIIFVLYFLVTESYRIIVINKKLKNNQTVTLTLTEREENKRAFLRSIIPSIFTLVVLVLLFLQALERIKPVK